MSMSRTRRAMPAGGNPRDGKGQPIAVCQLALLSKQQPRQGLPHIPETQ